MPHVGAFFIRYNDYMEAVYHVYILECKDGSLYTGITTDVERRFLEHMQGTASHYTSAKGASNMVYVEKHIGRSNASKREAAIKKMKRQEKLALIQQSKKIA